MKGKRPPTNLEFALLGLVHPEPLSGYDARKVFETTALGNYSSSPGAIYPALRRLEQQGLVEGEVEKADSLRPRKMFRPTEEGRAAMREWLTREITRDEVSRGMDGIMLRFSFHGLLGSPDLTREFLDSLAVELEAYVGELEAQRGIFPPEAPIQSRLALDAGIGQYEALARWAREARDHFAEEES